MRVGAYVDGYNLYYGGRAVCGRGAPGWRWLDVRSLIGEAVVRGGHIRVGLEDALLGTPASTTNLGLVEDAVRTTRNHGAEPATPNDVRQALGAISSGCRLGGPV